jgi:hypothetical protein
MGPRTLARAENLIKGEAVGRGTVDMGDYVICQHTNLGSGCIREGGLDVEGAMVLGELHTHACESRAWITPVALAH